MFRLQKLAFAVIRPEIRACPNSINTIDDDGNDDRHDDDGGGGGGDGDEGSDDDDDDDDDDDRLGMPSEYT